MARPVDAIRELIVVPDYEVGCISETHKHYAYKNHHLASSAESMTLVGDTHQIFEIGTGRDISRIRETMCVMSNFIPNSGSPKLKGLGPKAQRLAALREKAAKADNGTASTAGATASAPKPKNSFAGKKTAFQRKAT